MLTKAQGGEMERVPEDLRHHDAADFMNAALLVAQYGAGITCLAILIVVALGWTA
jgi:hypothetical protein